MQKNERKGECAVDRTFSPILLLFLSLTHLLLHLSSSFLFCRVLHGILNVLVIFGHDECRQRRGDKEYKGLMEITKCVVWRKKKKSSEGFGCLFVECALVPPLVVLNYASMLASPNYLKLPSLDHCPGFLHTPLKNEGTAVLNSSPNTPTIE